MAKMNLELPCRLSVAYTVGRREVMHSRDPNYLSSELRERESYCRRDLGIKLLENLDLDQAVTVRLRRHAYEEPVFQDFTVTLDLELMAVETMRVVTREFVPKPVEYRAPKPEPKPATPSLWQRYCNYVDRTRASLGG